MHVATTGDDKTLKVWSIADGLNLVNERCARIFLPSYFMTRTARSELPKKPTEVSFTRDGQTIVVSDKFGDVFRYVRTLS